MVSKQSGSVSARTEEEGMPKIDLAGISGQQVPAHGKHGEYGSKAEQVQRRARAGNQRENKHEDEEDNSY
jgi:hypothetical protein